MPFSSHSCWQSDSALFATVFINGKINTAAALTPVLEEPIGGFTYKTGCSGSAQPGAGATKFSKGTGFEIRALKEHFLKVIHCMFQPDVVVSHKDGLNVNVVASTEAMQLNTCLSQLH